MHHALVQSKDTFGPLCLQKPKINPTHTENCVDKWPLLEKNSSFEEVRKAHAKDEESAQMTRPRIRYLTYVAQRFFFKQMGNPMMANMSTAKEVEIPDLIHQ